MRSESIHAYGADLRGWLGSENLSAPINAALSITQPGNNKPNETSISGFTRLNVYGDIAYPVELTANADYGLALDALGHTGTSFSGNATPTAVSLGFNKVNGLAANFSELPGAFPGGMDGLFALSRSFGIVALSTTHFPSLPHADRGEPFAHHRYDHYLTMLLAVTLADSSFLAALIPEPEMLGHVGLGLLGFLGIRRSGDVR